MNNEQYHPIPPEAQEHLDRIEEEGLRESLSNNIQTLHHVENPFDQEHPPVFISDSERVKNHMSSIAEQASVAYSELLSKNPGTEISTTDIWNSVLEKELTIASIAKKRGESQDVIKPLIDYLIITELTKVPSYNDKDIVKTTLNETIERGLAPELIEAARQSYGLVHINKPNNDNYIPGNTIPETKIISIAHIITAIQPQLEIVNNREISLDPNDPALGEKLVTEAIQKRIGQLSLKDAVSTVNGIVSTEEYDETDKEDTIDRLTKHSLEEFSRNEEKDKAKQLIKLLKANPSLAELYEDEFQSIRNIRSVHTPYRVNDQRVYYIDETLVSLWEQGFKDLAGRLLTAGNEIEEGENIGIGAIDFLVSQNPELRQEIKEEVRMRKYECLELLNRALSIPNKDTETDFDKTHDDNVDSIIYKTMHTQDPEKSTRIILEWAKNNNSEKILHTLQLMDDDIEEGMGFNLLLILTSKDNPLIDLDEINKIMEVTDKLSKQYNNFPREMIRDSVLLDNSKEGEVLREQLGLVAKHPLMNMLAEGGIFHDKASMFLDGIFANNNKVAMCDNIYNSLTKQEPFWKILTRFSELLVEVKVQSLGEKQRQNVDIIPFVRIKLGVSSTGAELDDIQGFEPHLFSELTVKQKRLITTDNLSNLSDEEVIELKNLTFDKFSDRMKQTLLSYQIQQTVEQSRDTTQKEKAELRNHLLVSQEIPVVEERDFVHGTKIELLSSILIDGNMAGESRKLESSKDSFPYNVDFGVINNENTTQNKIENTISFKDYGRYGEQGDSGQILLVYKRNKDSWMAGHETQGSNSQHALIFGGIPSTEISGIILRDSSSIIIPVSKIIVENGFYIPLYDLQGNIIFDYEQYCAMKKDLNMDVQIPPENIIDNSVKVDTKLGSNEGGVYIFPTQKGPERYYVKFATDTDHTWTEYAADKLYEIAGVDVPDSKIVIVDGRLGRASKWVENESEFTSLETSTVEDGAAMDMLLANWDVVFNPANRMTINNRVIRQDSGSALDMWATGIHKIEGTWGNEVKELNFGNDRNKLWEGMRQEYPKLTDEELKKQVQHIQETLTDGVIDSVIDSIRRLQKDRDEIKSRLKARRDYMVKEVLNKESI
jgi:hypothetical protein